VCRQSDKHTDTLSTKLRFHTRAENIASCHSTGQVCVQPRSSAVRMTLPAFAAERRAAASLLLVYVAPAPAAVGLYLRSLSSKPAAYRCCCRLTGQKTTDRRTLDRYIDPAPHAMRAVLIKYYTNDASNRHIELLFANYNRRS